MESFEEESTGLDPSIIAELPSIAELNSTWDPNITDLPSIGELESHLKRFLQNLEDEDNPSFPEVKKMDREYFSKENVLSDLNAFANESGHNNTPLDLVNIRRTEFIKLEITCCNNESLNGAQYLDRAFRTLGLKSMSYKNILYTLLEIAGFKVLEMDEEYFDEDKNIAEDLDDLTNDLANKLGQDLTPLALLDVSDTCIEDLEVICCNGDRIKGKEYLMRACKILKLENKSYKHILSKLLEIAGYTIEKFDEMDKEYFSQENILKDLDAFARQLGEDKTPPDLYTSKYEYVRNIKAVCCNGESVEMSKYLKCASKAIDVTYKISKTLASEKDMLLTLLVFAGYEIEDYEITGLVHNEINREGIEIDDYEELSAKYFSQKNILKDLNEFARQLGEEKTPLDLLNIRRREFEELEIICCNDTPLTGSQYLYRVNERLGLGTGSYKKILKWLLEKAGFNIFEYDEMNEEYFSQKNVLKDLNEFAKQLGGDENLPSINVNKILGIQIICCNNEKINGREYLKRAKRALKIGNPVKLSSKKTWLELCKKAGLSVIEYDDMDKEYFSQKNVLKDLTKFAKQLGPDKTPIDLLSINRIDFEELKILCCNNELVNGEKYLARVNRQLKNKKSYYQKTLITLLKIAGFDTVKYEEMDEKYYSQDNVLKDLNEFARQLGSDKTPEDLLNIKKSEFEELKIICCNDTPLTGSQYLYRINVRLGLGTTNFKKILKWLLEKAGFAAEPEPEEEPPRTRRYYFDTSL